MHNFCFCFYWAYYKLELRLASKINKYKCLAWFQMRRRILIGKICKQTKSKVYKNFQESFHLNELKWLPLPLAQLTLDSKN